MALFVYIGAAVCSLNRATLLACTFSRRRRTINSHLLPDDDVSSCQPAAARFSEHGQRAGYCPVRRPAIHAHSAVKWRYFLTVHQAGRHNGLLR